MAEMTAQEAAEWGKTLDFPTVWAALMKNEAQINSLGKKVDKTAKNINELTKHLGELQNSMGEKVDKTTKNVNELTKHLGELQNSMGEKVDKTTKNVNELTKHLGELQNSMGEKVDKTTKNINELTKHLGGLHNSMGDLVETLFAPHLGEKFEAYGYNLKRIFHRVFIYDETTRQRGEIDILLSNTTVCMAVEVKRWLDNTEKVDEHIKRMQLIRKYPPAETKGKRLLGAIVGAVVTPDVRGYAEQNGFFVLELTGEDVCLLEPPKDFQPKEW
jgi:hypothetical protein